MSRTSVCKHPELFGRKMVSRIKPEHQSPVESFRRVACTCCAEGFPHIWNRSNDTIMNVSRCRGSIACLSKGRNSLARHKEFKDINLYGIQVQILVDSPFRAKHKDTLSSLARHILGIYHEAAGLRHEATEKLYERHYLVIKIVSSFFCLSDKVFVSLSIDLQ